eukprot:6332-Eustigmatos_ZCMA.PRE.1
MVGAMLPVKRYSVHPGFTYEVCDLEVLKLQRRLVDPSPRVHGRDVDHFPLPRYVVPQALLHDQTQRKRVDVHFIRKTAYKDEEPAYKGVC